MSATRSDPPPEAVLVERIARLEERKGAIAAEQSDAILEFARAHAQSQTAGGSVDPEALERSIAAQVGLACRVSPTEGRRRVRTARDLHTGHARVRELFAAGQLSEYTTATIVAPPRTSPPPSARRSTTSWPSSEWRPSASAGSTT